MKEVKVKVANVHKIFLGILTGVFMFAAYFLIDMYIVYVDYDFYHTVFKANELYFILFSFAVGIIFSIIYISYYNRGVRRGRRVV